MGAHGWRLFRPAEAVGLTTVRLRQLRLVVVDIDPFMPEANACPAEGGGQWPSGPRHAAGQAEAAGSGLQAFIRSLI